MDMRVPPFAQGQALAAGLGLQLARVIDLEDPAQQGRVRIRLFALSGVDDQEGELWARVCTLFAGNNRGAFWMPDIDDEVLVGFVMGDPTAPIVLGGLWSGSAAPPEQLDAQNRLKVVRSRNGNRLILDDTEGAERALLETPGGQRLTLAVANGGSALLEDAAGNSVSTGPAGVTHQVGNKFTLNAAEVEINAARVTINAALVDCSGVVRCMTLQTQAVISASYTPGAGNIW